MGTSAYKEKYRQDMIVWSEAIRNKNPEHFCKLATAKGVEPVWLVCDARRESDMLYFHKYHSCRLLTVRVHASEEVRAKRGWVYNKEVDDAQSECGLDHYKCDTNIKNGSECESELEEQLQMVVSWVRMMTQ